MRITVDLDPVGEGALAKLQSLGMTQREAVSAALKLLHEAQAHVHDGEVTFLNHHAGPQTLVLTD